MGEGKRASLGQAETGTSSPTRRSRPTSIPAAGQTHVESQEGGAVAPPSASTPQTTSVATQTLATAPISTNYEFVPVTVQETFFYSKAIQTAETWSPQGRNQDSEDPLESDSDRSPSRKAKLLSRREREREEELRQSLRREIEEELNAIKEPIVNGATGTAQAKYPARALTEEELNAVTSSEDFLDFVERSSKVIEKALDEDYDVLVDYGADDLKGVAEDEDEGYGSSRAKKGRRIKEVMQFYDERWSRKRMISDIGYSPKVGTLTLSRTLAKKPSFRSCFSLHIPRIQLRLKIPQASFKYGICIYTPGPNMYSTPRPTSSQLDFLLSIHPSSLEAPMVGKCLSGIHGPSLLYRYKRRL